MYRKRHFRILFAIAGIVALAGCSRTADYKEAFTAEVERMCANYCALNLECQEPPAFEGYDECESYCLGLSYVYNDTECGEAKRAKFECIGSQPTCELYDDTQNVHADEYTCKAEKDAFTSLNCGDSDEDPYPHDTP